MNYLLNLLQIILVVNILILFLFFLDKFLPYALKPLWRKCLLGAFGIRLLLPFPIYINLFPGIPLQTEVYTLPAVSENEASTEKTESSTHAETIETYRNSDTSDQTAILNAFHVPGSFHPEIIFVIWLSGTLVLLRVHISQYQYLKKLYIETAYPCKKKQIKILQDKLQKEYKFRFQPEILIQNQLKSPVLLGYIDSKLLLPDFQYSEKEQEFILRHELLHAKHFDQWYKLLFTIICDIYWFAPIFRLMRKMAYEDVEYVCDRRVLRNQDLESQKIYAKMLLKTSSKDFMLSAQLSSGKNPIRKRLHILFHASKNRQILLPAILCGLFLIGSITPAPEQKEDSVSAPQELLAETLPENVAEDTELPAAAPTEEQVLAMREKIFADVTPENFAVMRESIKVANQSLEWMVMYDNLFDRLEDPDSSAWDDITHGGRFHAENFSARVQSFKALVDDELLQADFDHLISNLAIVLEQHDADALKDVYHIVHDMDYFLFRYGPSDVGIYMKDISTVSKYYGSLHIYE